MRVVRKIIYGLITICFFLFLLLFVKAPLKMNIIGYFKENSASRLCFGVSPKMCAENIDKLIVGREKNEFVDGVFRDSNFSEGGIYKYHVEKYNKDKGYYYNEVYYYQYRYSELFWVLVGTNKFFYADAYRLRLMDGKIVSFEYSE